ncbi:MAG: glycosyl hydrolase family 28 protein [Bacteroidales bacterium]|nr:glycosyl hydrolase family 28 protein [Bacteroidales bacterium]MCM1146791.1 glycosyl hydrolase family 28 protein [Bacteroidales bacterium]MCM1205712.1 glycosyl hydrolase family 28 protein [Bacillota bacterium]MCM1510758.1 glycosyl hydrolase family 28 protein [Clostridium sp.]
MKPILTLLLFVISLSSNAAKKNTGGIWPDGTKIASWFSDKRKVAVDTLGRQYVITDYGVKNDSTVIQTSRIQAVIDRCADEGGGVVVIPEGTFLSGSLFFRQGTHLLVHGKLKGSDRIRDFRLLRTRMEGQTLNYFAALVNADSIDGFVISGHGTIDGNGHDYWEEFWYRRMYNPQCTNLEAMRPRLVYISNSSNVTVQDIRLVNSPFWTNHLYRSHHVRYLDCHIEAPVKGIVPPGDTEEHGAPSSDAIDLDACHDVLISGCYMQVNDDAVVLKGGKGTWADKNPDNGPVCNVMVEDCRYGVVHGCLTVGSEAIHVRNIIVRNITFNDANRFLWLKMRPDTPQHYERIRVENVAGTCGSFLVIRPWRQFYKPEERKDMPLSECHDIDIRNITVSCKNFFDVGTSDKYSLRDFSFTDCDVTDQRHAFDAGLITNTVTRNLVIK